MSDYETAWDALADAVGGHFPNLGSLTTDQKLKAAEVAALLSIAQELSSIVHHGTAQSGQMSE